MRVQSTMMREVVMVTVLMATVVMIMMLSGSRKPEDGCIWVYVKAERDPKKTRARLISFTKRVPEFLLRPFFWYFVFQTLQITGCWGMVLHHFLQ